MSLPERPPPFTYTLEHGSYYWHGHSGSLEKMCDRVAVAFDRSTGILLKHGSPEQIEAYARRANAVLMHPPESQWAVATMVFPEGYPPAEINRCIANSNYLPVLLVQMGFSPPCGDSP